MNWHTDEEIRQDAEKRMESQRAFERLKTALDERRKNNIVKEKKQKSHAKKHIKFRIRILKRQRTASSSHSWMPSDVAEEAGDVADEHSDESSHSWMHSNVEDVDEATPSSPHSWMHEETERCFPMLKMATGDQVLLGRDQ